MCPRKFGKEFGWHGRKIWATKKALQILVLHQFHCNFLLNAGEFDFSKILV
jgi:hypothetical protein